MGIGVTPEPIVTPGAPTVIAGETVLPGRSGKTLTVEWRVRQVTAGGLHACAIAQTGAPYCWGDNV